MSKYGITISDALKRSYEWPLTSSFFGLYLDHYIGILAAIHWQQGTAYTQVSVILCCAWCTHALQRCHSRKIKIPRRTTEKNPENLRSNFYAIGSHFGEKSNFSGKSVSSPRKFLMTFFLVIDWLSNSHPFIDQKLRKQ